MCRRCDQLQEHVSSSREDEPCAEDEHNWSESSAAPDTEIICINCGWSLAEVKQHSRHALEFEMVDDGD